jgi:2-oxoisovalerate dehydrogenase E2 component (dihydrolipoyl transacylase)
VRPVTFSPPSGRIPADSRQPIRGLQRMMVKSMTAAWQTPHFGYSDEVVVDGLMQARALLRPVAERAGVPKLTYLPLLLKAASLALSQFPTLNAQLSADGQELVLRGPHNLGVAMDTPRGLIVPNVKACQDKSVLEIASEIARLQGLAAAGKLGEADLSDTTFR